MRLTKQQVIEELKGEIEVYRSSYREKGGRIRNRAALRTIEALKLAVQAVKKSANK